MKFVGFLNTKKIMFLTSLKKYFRNFQEQFTEQIVIGSKTLGEKNLGTSQENTRNLLQKLTGEFLNKLLEDFLKELLEDFMYREGPRVAQ